MACPEARPSAWDVACICCGRVAGTTPLNEDDASWWSIEQGDAMRCSNRSCENFGERAFDVRDGNYYGARWGYEWKAVAVLAYALKVIGDRQVVILAAFCEHGVDQLAKVNP